MFAFAAVTHGYCKQEQPHRLVYLFGGPRIGEETS